MTPKYARCVDPIISYVLELLDRIERGTEPDPARENSEIKKLFNKAEAEFGSTDEWVLARYALAAWVDEVLIIAPWKGAVWWVNNTLEWHFFNTALRGVLFFNNASRATQLATRNAIEIYYICVVLGFRGIYRERTASLDSQPFSPDLEPQRIAALAESEGLPSSLRAWFEQAAASIRGGGLPQPEPHGVPPSQAYPLEAQSLLIGSLLVFAVLGAITLITAMLTLT